MPAVRARPSSCRSLAPAPPLPCQRTQSNLSYTELFERLRGSTDPEVLRERCPKVCREAQARAPGAARIWFSDVFATPQGRAFTTGKLLAVPTTRVSSEAAYNMTVFTIAARVAVLTVLHATAAGWAARRVTRLATGGLGQTTLSNRAAWKRPAALPQTGRQCRNANGLRGTAHSPPHTPSVHAIAARSPGAGPPLPWSSTC